MFSHVFKDSEASKKAWLKRQRAQSKKPAPESGLGTDLAKHFEKYDDPNLTVKQVMADFTPEERGEIASAIIKAKAMPTSKSFWTGKDGKYKPERLALHRKIISDILSTAAIKDATPADGETPTFVVLGGRGGSGKSSFTNGRVNEFDAKKFLVLDTDAIKERLKPPYKGWNAFNVHEESSDIFSQVTQIAKSLKLNIVHDATLKSRGVEDTIKEFKDDGYDIEGHYMFVPRQVSANRAVKRYLGKDGKRGRLVPVEVILENTENEKNFDAMKPYFKKWSAYDNQGAEPKLISRKEKKK